MSSRTSKVNTKATPGKRELQRQIEDLQKNMMLLAGKFKPSVEAMDAALLVQTSITQNKDPESWTQEDLDFYNERLNISRRLIEAFQRLISEQSSLPENSNISIWEIWYALAFMFGRVHTTVVQEVATKEKEESFSKEYVAFIKTSVAHIKFSPHEYFLQEDVPKPWELDEFKDLITSNV